MRDSTPSYFIEDDPGPWIDEGRGPLFVNLDVGRGHDYFRRKCHVLYEGDPSSSILHEGELRDTPFDVRDWEWVVRQWEAIHLPTLEGWDELEPYSFNFLRRTGKSIQSGLFLELRTRRALFGTQDYPTRVAASLNRNALQIDSPDHWLVGSYLQTTVDTYLRHRVAGVDTFPEAYLPHLILILWPIFYLNPRGEFSWRWYVTIFSWKHLQFEGGQMFIDPTRKAIDEKSAALFQRWSQFLTELRSRNREV